jgi:hypothetical chaperone protein
MDFGTTNSGMSVYDGKSLSLIPLESGTRNPAVSRTALYMTNDRSIYIGNQATSIYYEQNLNRPSRYERVYVGEIELTFAELPTFIRDVYIEKDVFSPGRLFLSFKMGLSSPNYLGTMVGNQYFFLEDIIGTYLYITRKRAEAYLQTDLDTIMLGRPVRFSDDEEHNQFALERLIHAAFRAGYRHVYLQYEPIAAAYYYETTINHEQNILVFDFGGGTLDISVIRVGNPATRAVLANGGIAIAGDIFDRRIVRAKYPSHFGEGSSYRSGNSNLPVPASLYDAFADWQELLTLQNPKTMETIRQIEHAALHPHKIRALIGLITSQYGLKMYETAEQAKRLISQQQTARLDLKGTGFQVYDTLTRQEFERMIKADVRAISTRLDEVLQQAGIRPDQIHAVIRTGGSSQIPLFVEMLENRFGKDRVQELDVFSSVTSGLGVIAHQLERGEISLTGYHAGEFPGSRFLRQKGQESNNLVDFDVIMRVIDVQEQHIKGQKEDHILVLRGVEQRLDACYFDNYDSITPDFLHTIDKDAAIFAGKADTRLTLITGEYAFYNRLAAEIGDIRQGGLYLEHLENFRVDEFGKEMITAITPFRNLVDKDFLVLVSSMGYAQKFVGRLVIDKLSMPVPYRPSQRLRGVPAAFIGVNSAEDLILISSTARALRIPINTVTLRDSRLLTISKTSSVLGGFGSSSVESFWIGSANGILQKIYVDHIVRGKGAGKIGTLANIVTMLPQSGSNTLFALTSERILPIEPADTEQITVPLLKKRGEKLVALFSL